MGVETDVEVSAEGDRDGYRRDEGAGWRHRTALRRPQFPRTPWGHRGYDESTVDAFARDAVIKVTAAELEVEELRSEIDRLHRYIRRQWAAIAAAADGASPPDANGASPAAQARAVLAHANESAQRHVAAATRRLDEAERQAEERLVAAETEAARRVAVAEASGAVRVARAEDVASQRLASADAMAEEVLAEAGRRAAQRLRRASEEARRVTGEARAGYQEVLAGAHSRADQAATVALHEYEARAAVEDDPARAGELRELRAAYLRTLARVSRAAMETVVASSVREFDDLLAQVGEEEAADPHLPATPVTGLPAEAVDADATPPSGVRTPVITLYPDMHPGRRAPLPPRRHDDEMPAAAGR